MQVLARVVVLVVLGQLHRHAERHPARDDRDLVNRIGVRQEHREQRVPRLVDRRDLLLRLADHRAPLGAHGHLVLRELEVEHANGALVVARRVQPAVHQVREIGAREAGRPARQHVDVDVVGQRDLLRVDGEDPLAPLRRAG